MLYRTAPYGGIRQEAFLNAAALIETSLSALVLLELLKEIEARAGRAYTGRSGIRWGPRPLDIDIIDYKRIVCNWKMHTPLLGNKVILPHAEAHKRAFVLRPLAEIVPFWHHPIFGSTATELLKKPDVARAGAILEKLDSRP
jgi:2-amino-4-hydroxy-6-hydroxymethyldihydropteridine diphosphokinase